MTSLSERATSTIPAKDQPLSEQFRLVAKSFVDADAAARLLEECKSVTLAQRMKALGDMPAAHAEREVRSTPEWAEYIKQMVDARTKANLAKVKLEYIRMRHSEWMAIDATARAEMKMSR